MRAYSKNVLRTIWGNKRRSLMLLLITALGAAFYIGLRSTSPDMNLTFNGYYESQKMYDIRVISTYGLSSMNISQLNAVDGVKYAEPAYSADLFAKHGDASYLFRVHSYSPTNADGVTLAAPVIVEGKLPIQSGECAVSQRFSQISGCAVGDVLVLSTGDDTHLDSIAAHDTYTVTGLIESPLYVRADLGSSTKGSGSLQAFAYIPFDDFTLERYTEAHILLENPDSYSRFDDRFNDMSVAVEDALQDLGDDIAIRRRRVLMDRASKDISNSVLGIAAARDALAVSERELQESEIAFANSEQELIAQRTALNESILSGRWQLDSGNAEIKRALSDIEQGKLAIRDGYRQLDEMRSALSDNASNSQLNQAEAELIAKERELALAVIELEAQQSALTEKYAALDAALYGGLAELAAAEAELASARDTLEDARLRFDAEKASAESLMATSEAALNSARRMLRSMPDAKCYVLGLDSDLGFFSFKQDSERIDSISHTIPLIFFLVAALVAFTSMMRIVEDDRSASAVMLSLGYSSLSIVGKYVIYALSISVPGTLLGIAIGYRLFPTLIFDYGYKIMYLVPSITKVIYPELCMGAFTISLISVVVPTVFVSTTDIRQTPATLLRPKAPPPGKRILLEHIKILWSRMSFSAKVTARNILRYKKRFLMTVAGISGCTAIVLTGFGLRDSIKSIAANQFNNIYLYDFTVTISDGIGRADRTSLERYLSSQSDIIGWQYQHRENIDVLTATADSYEAALVVPDDASMLSDYIRLAEPGTGASAVLSDRGVIITQKLASLIGASVGYELSFSDDDDVVMTATVTGITENYVGHYVYMTPGFYTDLTDSELEFTTIVSKVRNLDTERRDVLSEQILENKGVTALSFNEKVRDFYDDLLDSLNVVIFVMIVCGALLAFVVLFSLTGINIDERKREIATLKVLGFYDNEASSYIFRENIINTFAGAFVGLAFGIVLHQYVIRTVEIDMIMFGKIVALPSYLYATALTFLFTFIVNAVMSGGIRDIDMIESLKSVE